MEPLYHSTTKRLLEAIGPNAGSYVFAGPAGSGRRLAAIRLAQRLNCATAKVDDCPGCRSIAAGSFADLHLTASPGAIGIEQIQQLQQPLAQRPFSAETTRVVIAELDNGITLEAQSRLLKTLEEPPAQTIIIMITGQPELLLPTVRSRAQMVNFVPLAPEQIQQYLRTKVGQTQADAIISLNPSSLGEALTLAADPELRRDYEVDIREAQQFLTAGLFARLVTAQSIRLKAKAQNLINMLARQLATQPQLVSGYPALEQAQAELAANVGPRTVMEALALVL